MKSAHLRLVASNARNYAGKLDPPAQAFNAKQVFARVARVLAALVAVGVAPFRLLAFMGRVLVSTGLGFFAAIYRLFFALIGGAIIFVVIYGMAHVLFYPAFH